jgi:hypothetical protein
MSFPVFTTSGDRLDRGGEHRLGNDPGDRFRCERAEPRGALRLYPALSVGHRLDLGVGAKRPPHGGGPGAARHCRADRTRENAGSLWS